MHSEMIKTTTDMKKKYIIPEMTALVLSSNVVMLGASGDGENETKYFDSIVGDNITDETDGD